MTVAVPAINPAGAAAASIILPVLATLTFALRIYDRKVRRHIQLAKDDWALCASLVGLWALATVCLVGVGIGAMGMHSEMTQADDSTHSTIHRTDADEDMQKIVQVYSFIEKFAFFAYQASVCFAYRRIFTYPIFRRICLGVLIFLTIRCIAFLVVTALQCRLRNWGVWYQDWAARQHCVQSNLVWVAYTVSEVAVDLFLLLSPLPFILKLQMSPSKKISTVVMFSLGSLSVAMGIARMAYLLAFTYTGDRGYRDLMGLQSIMLVWSLTECSAAIIASNIPSLRNLIFRDKFGRTKSWWAQFTGSGRGHDESRFSDRRRLTRDHSVGAGPGGRNRGLSVGIDERDSRGWSKSNTRDSSVGQPMIKGLHDVELIPVQGERTEG